MANGNGDRTTTLSSGTIRLIIEVATTALLVSGWGWTIKSDVRVQGVKFETFGEDVQALKKEVAFLRVQNEEIRVALAEKGILIRGTRP